MSFLYPAFLLGGLAIAIPIVLHLLRRDVAPQVPFTAVRLLQRSPIERADRRRLRDLLLLAARIAALLLLAAAFARPYAQGALPPPLRIVALDRSFSMGAPALFARARMLAREAVDEAAGSERIAVVAFDERAEIVAPPGGAAQARAALDALAPGFGSTRYGPLFQQAQELAAGAAGRLVVVTDLQRAGWEGLPPPTLPVGWTMDVRDAAPAGGARLRRNLAVTATTVDKDRVVASIYNDGSDARSGRLRALLDGQGVAVADYTASPGQTTDVTIGWQAPETGTLRLEIDDVEGPAADNTRFVALGGRRPPKALVVAEGAAVGAGKSTAVYLPRALGVSSDDSIEVVPGSRLAAMSAEEVSNHQGIALLSTRGLERAARERLTAYVKDGGGLFLAASADLEVTVLAEMTGWQPALSASEQPGPLTLAATDLRHPIFRPFGALAVNLGQVRFDRAWRVAPEGWSVIARFSNGTPALLDRRLGEGRVVLFASDVERRWNDFPLHPAFVPFALEALRYVAGDRRESQDYTVADAPAVAGRTPGVYRSADDRPYAVNVDPRESALASMPADDFARMVERSDRPSEALVQLAQQTESRQSYWQYGLVLMIATLVAESVVGRA